MAKENKDGQEKTEDATGKKLDDMRKKGQVPRSQELKTLIVTMTGAVLIIMLAGDFSQGLEEVFTQGFTVSKEDTSSNEVILSRFSDAIDTTFWMLLPYFLGLIVAAYYGNTLLGGFVISGDKMKPKFSNMSPAKGLKRMFGKDGLVKLGVSLLKVILIGGVTYFLLAFFIDDFLGLVNKTTHIAIHDMLSMLGDFTLAITATLIIIAAIDVPYQIYKHKTESKMTKQEVKDERKQTDGSDEVKGKIRQMQYQRAQQRMMDEVPNADVIITNPTHFAVALRYDDAEMGAPIVLAKGADQVAQHIREIGEFNRVTIVEAPMLARAIFFTTEIDEAIPAGLYLAVAKLLAYAYQLEVSPFDIRDDDRVRDQWEVPEDMKFDTSGKKQH